MANAAKDANYARVSADKSEQQETIATQLFHIRKRWAGEGRPVYGEYLDDPYSGAYLNRPALDRLMADAEKGCFDRVLIYHPDRLSRGETWHRPMLEARLRAAGVTVHYVNYEQQDTPEGQMLDDMLSSFASFERKRIVQRMADGHDRRLSEGAIWRSNRTYGWRYVLPSGKERYGHLELVPEEAAVVREVFDLVLGGKTAHSVAGMLNSRGLVNVSGKPFTPLAVQRMIHNPLHCGRPATRRYEAVEAKKPRDRYTGQRKLSTRERPRDEWQRVDLPYSIVTPEEQAQAEARLSANRKLASRNGKREYLLAGLIRCGCGREADPTQECGRNMYGILERRGIRRYRCNRAPANDPTSSRCCRGSYRADVLETVVWDQMLALITQPEVLLEFVTAANANAGECRNRLMRELAGAQETHQAQQNKLDSLLSVRLEGGLDRATYERKQAQLVTARQDAAAHAAHLEKELAQMSTEQLCSPEDIAEFCQFLAAIVIGATQIPNCAAIFAAKQQAIRRLITAIWVYPDGRIRIEGAVSLSPQMEPCAIDIPRPMPLNHNCATGSWPSSRFSILIAA